MKTTNSIDKLDTIGIALTSYNPDEKLLLRQLKSIKEQTYKNWICCITIDNDEFKTYEKESIKEIISDDRFHLYYNSNRLGFLKNFETAISKVLNFKVDAIIMADHDDEWTLNRLDRLRSELIGLPKYSLVHSDMKIRIQSKDNDYIKDKTVWELEHRNTNMNNPSMVLQRNIVGGATSLIDVNVFKLSPKIPESVKFHDHWYGLLSSVLGTVKPIHEPLYYYTQHQNNVAGTSKFNGVFHISESQNLIKTCIEKWEYAQLLANEIKTVIPTPPPKNWNSLFFSRYNFVSNFIQTISYLKSDKALFRASLAISLGKFFRVFIKS